jgi:hypothetical protein
LVQKIKNTSKAITVFMSVKVAAPPNESGVTAALGSGA